MKVLLNIKVIHYLIVDVDNDLQLPQKYETECGFIIDICSIKLRHFAFLREQQ